MSATKWELPQKAGEEETFTFQGKVKLRVLRTRNRSWFLQEEGVRDHARWADTQEQARSDIDHFMNGGALPRGTRGW